MIGIELFVSFSSSHAWEIACLHAHRLRAFACMNVVLVSVSIMERVFIIPNSCAIKEGGARRPRQPATSAGYGRRPREPVHTGYGRPPRVGWAWPGVLNPGEGVSFPSKTPT